jgi:hypothetical protein
MHTDVAGESIFDTAMRMRSYCCGPLKLKLLGRAGASSIVTSQILATELRLANVTSPRA